MKKFFYLLPAVALLFAACSDDDDDNGGGLVKDNKITVKASDLTNPPSNSDIDRVILFAENTKELASSKWDNGFEIELPETVASSNLENIIDFLDFDEEDEEEFFKNFTISDKTANITSAYIRAYKGDDRRNYFFETTGSTTEATWVEYVYVDKDLAIKGSSTYTDDDGDVDINKISVSLKKGWNKVFNITWEKEIEGGIEYYGEVTTSLLSGLHWVYDDL